MSVAPLLDRPVPEESFESATRNDPFGDTAIVASFLIVEDPVCFAPAAQSSAGTTIFGSMMLPESRSRNHQAAVPPPAVSMTTRTMIRTMSPVRRLGGCAGALPGTGPGGIGCG